MEVRKKGVALSVIVAALCTALLFSSCAFAVSSSKSRHHAPDVKSKCVQKKRKLKHVKEKNAIIEKSTGAASLASGGSAPAAAAASGS